jgi:NitT/TauT family transport system substrate-binding protein
MNWLPCYEWAAFLLGEKEGFYEEFGIDLNLIPGKGSSVSVKMVATQKVSFGLAAASNVLMAKEKNMPIKALACLQPNTSVAIFLERTGESASLMI